MRRTRSASQSAGDQADSAHSELPRNFRQSWYPLSLSKDLPRGSDPVGLHILGDPIVLFRDGSGKAAVLEDKCLHRSAPLSVGRVMDGHLECRYHGWQYEATGKVSAIPALLPDRNLTSVPSIRAYPVAEIDGIIWAYPGKAADANCSDIPRLRPGMIYVDAEHVVHHTEQPASHYYVFDIAMDLDIDHSLMIENLLDPAHLPFAHENTIGRRADAGPLEMIASSLDRKKEFLHGWTQRRTYPAGHSPATHFLFFPPCTVVLHTTFRKNWNFTQTMHCIPTRPGHMRLIYRQGMNFLTWIERLPFVSIYLARFSKKIVFQDYELLHGQQARLDADASAWNFAIQVDWLPKAYRQWYKKATLVSPYFRGWKVDIEDIAVLDKVACEGTCRGDHETHNETEMAVPHQRGVDNSAYYMRPAGQRPVLNAAAVDARRLMKFMWVPLLVLAVSVFVIYR